MHFGCVELVEHARLDALDTSNVSSRVVTSQVEFGLIASFSTQDNK